MTSHAIMKWRLVERESVGIPGLISILRKEFKGRMSENVTMQETESRSGMSEGAQTRDVRKV